MTLEELKERYKILPVWARVLVGVVVGILPCVYMLTDEGEELQHKVEAAQEQVSASRAKFEEARHKKANLPQLEEQMAYTEDQLAKAKLKLPDHVIMEDVLQKTATIAKQTGVQLSSFNPSAEVNHLQPYPFVEQPIATEITGRFGQIATFLDQMIHLDGTIFLRHIELVRLEGDDRTKVAQPLDDKKPAYDVALAARRGLQVRGKFDIVVYRSFTSQEEHTIVQPPPAAKPAEPKKTEAEAPPEPAAKAT